MTVTLMLLEVTSALKSEESPSTLKVSMSKVFLLRPLRSSVTLAVALLLIFLHFSGILIASALNVFFSLLSVEKSIVSVLTETMVFSVSSEPASRILDG